MRLFFWGGGIGCGEGVFVHVVKSFFPSLQSSFLGLCVVDGIFFFFWVDEAGFEYYFMFWSGR